MDMQGQTIVVVGGASGLGLAAAQAAAAAGASVIVTSIDPGRLKAGLIALGSAARGELLDVTREEEVQAFFERVGAFDHLATTVGDALERQHVLEQSTEAARRDFEIRFWGQYLVAKHAAGQIRAGGSITFTTGLAGHRATPGIVVLGAVCAAVEGLARGLAVELAPTRVNVVCPGVVDTGIWNALEPETRTRFLETTGSGLPVGHVGRPDELAQAYLYLMRNGYSTGAVVVSDGGAAILSH